MKCPSCGNTDLETINIKGRTFNWKGFSIVLAEDFFVTGCPACDDFFLKGKEQCSDLDDAIERSLDRRSDEFIFGV